MTGFTDHLIGVNGHQIACSVGGSGPAVLLLHGFPQTRALWEKVAPVLADRFTTVTTDLRGYGESSKPKGVENYTFREMGRDMAALFPMDLLGIGWFSIARSTTIGHRGAWKRVARVRPRRI